MFRIDDPSAAVTLPTPEAAGTEGYYTEGVPGVTPATKVRASWLNAVQESLRGVVVGVGLTPSKTIYTRLWDAIRIAAGGFVTTRTATATLTNIQTGLVNVNASAAMTLTLPQANNAAGVPMRYQFVRTDTTANVVTLSRAGSDLIEGLTTMPLQVGQRLELVSDGVSAWRLAAPLMFIGSQIFSSSGTFTVPAGVYRLKVTVVGGGASGGSTGTSTGLSGAGGGAGGTAIRWLSVVPGQTITVTVGLGGASAAAGAGAPGIGGNAGNTSSFGAFCSATGGSPGNGAVAGNTSGGQGGVGSGADLNFGGGAGADGQPNTFGSGGNGGNSIYGGGGRASTVRSAGVQDGQAPGAGGGCGYSNASVASGKGADGIVIVEW